MKKVFEISKASCDYTLDPCCVVTADNEKQALKTFRKSLLSSGEKTIVFNPFRKEFELVTSYGACYVAMEIMYW